MPSQHVSSPGPARHSRTRGEVTHDAWITTKPLLPLGVSTGRLPPMRCVSRLLEPHNERASVLEHTPEARDVWGSTLRTRGNGHPMAVCLARHQGPLVSALRTEDLLVLFPLPPLTLARSRAAFTPSRATAAPTAAALPLARLLTHRDKLQPLPPQRPTMRALDPRVAHRRRVVASYQCASPPAARAP